MLGESSDVLEPRVEGEVDPEADARVDGAIEGSMSSVASVSADVTKRGECPSDFCGRTTASTLVSCFRACISSVWYLLMFTPTSSTLSITTA